MKDALIVSTLSLVPKNPVARFMGRSARLRLPPWLHRALVGWFVRKYRIDLTECQGKLDDYPTLAELFVRPLRPGLRPVDPRPDVLVSPVDGRAHSYGTIEDGRFVQAKGVTASVAELLGGAGGPQALDPSRFDGGGYCVLYLSPHDYHRVHTPAKSTVAALRYLPGQLWPVFPAATRRVAGLFGRNERLVFALDTDPLADLGCIAQVMVGAFGVGRMSTVVSDVTTNTGGAAADQVFDPAPTLERGAELGRFALGSTVILLTMPGKVRWTLKPGQPVRLGRAIGQAIAPSDEPA